MKGMLKIFRKLMLVVLSSMLLFSCNKTTTPEAKLAKEVVEENAVSKLASDPEFLNKLHEIRNPMTYTTMLVKGDGTIVLKTMEPNIEQLGVVEDIDKNTTNYIYKTYNGEGLETKTYGEGESQFESTDLSIRTVFYDKDGKEVGLTTNSYGANYSSKSKIIYRDNSLPYGEKDLRAFDVNTKEISELPYKNIYSYDGKFWMSTDEYGDDKEANEVIVVYDGDLKEIKRIEGYSLNGVENRKDAYIVRVSKRIKSDDGSDRKYNFIDENYQLLFDEDLDEIIWGDDFPVLTLRRGNNAFEYDFSKKEKVSEDKPYVEKKSSWEELMDEQRPYEELKLEVEKKGKYQYVNALVHGGNVLFLAYKDMNVGMFDDNTCDVYNEKLEHIASFDSVDNVFNEHGYIFANRNTIYNDKLETVKKFDVKCHVERVDKFDKVFFSNGTAEDYSKRKDFELYDENFNVVFDHIDSLDSYVYDDYFVMTRGDNTYFADKDLNIVKEILGRPITIQGWYRDEIKYRPFVDLKTERMGIIDNEFQFLVDGLKDVSSLTKNYFTYQSGFKYGLMDYEGIPILTYSIFDTMREDAVEKDFAGEFVTEY